MADTAHPILRLNPEATPFELKHMTPALAKRLNTLFRPTAPLNVGGYDLSLVPYDGPVPGGPWLDATINTQPAAIAISWGQARRIAGLPLEDADPTDAALLLEDAMSDVLNSAEALTGLELRFRKFISVPPDATSFEKVALRVGDHELPLRLSQEAAASLGYAAERIAAPRPLSDMLPVTVVVRMASVALSVADLRSLQAGDGLVIGEGDDAPVPQLIVAGTHTAPISRTGSTIEFLGPLRPIPKPKDTTMSDTATPDTEAEATTPLDLDALEVEVHVEAGMARLTLGDLRQLGAGAILDLAGPADASVTLTVNGQRIGTGDLIRVADRRAVQIRTLENDG